MKEEKAMLMGCTKFGLQELVALSSGTTFEIDLTSVNRLERVQQCVIRNVGRWCVEYEEQVPAEPHHADIMLKYLHVVLLATQPTFEIKHHFVRTNSKFNSVRNAAL